MKVKITAELYVNVKDGSMYDFPAVMRMIDQDVRDHLFVGIDFMELENQISYSEIYLTDVSLLTNV
jgi:hypothetical protein